MKKILTSLVFIFLTFFLLGQKTTYDTTYVDTLFTKGFLFLKSKSDTICVYSQEYAEFKVYQNRDGYTRQVYLKTLWYLIPQINKRVRTNDSLIIRFTRVKK